MTLRGLFQSDEKIVRRRPTRWLHPIEVLRAAFHAFFSTTIAGYIDRRESMAVLPRLRPEDQPRHGSRVALRPSGPDAVVEGDGDLWIDFIADIGDGFDATYAMASLLARKRLHLRGLEEPLERADLVVLGGDLVYPTPSRDQYRTRLQGPLAAAFPNEPDPARPKRERSASIFAIPGNHDWYDGLTNFVRVFCQGGNIGGWRLWQSRSYWAIRLPHRWWLWGVDIQLSTRIDPPQLKHFLDLSAVRRGSPGAPHGDQDLVQKGDRIIVCTPKPAWYEAGRRDDGLRNLRFFEEQAIRAAGAEATVMLSGDVHHYARFVSDDDRQRITSGSGGAYLCATHLLPRKLSLHDSNAPAGDVDLTESGFPYPSRAESARLLWRTLWLPFRGANMAFCLMLGVLYAIAHYLFAPSGAPPPGVIRAQPATQMLGEYMLQAALELRADPLSAVLPAIFVSLAGVFAWAANRRRSAWTTWPWGLTHGLAHLSLAIVLGWLVLRGAERLGVIGAWQPYAIAPALVLAGWLAGGLLFALYLVLSVLWFGCHENEAYLSQNIIDFRSFVRMCLRDDGRLEIYPIGLRRTPRRWRRRIEDHASPDVAPGGGTGSGGQADAPRSPADEPDPDPADPGLLESADHFDLEPHLIEGPIILRPADPERPTR